MFYFATAWLKSSSRWNGEEFYDILCADFTTKTKLILTTFAPKFSIMERKQTTPRVNLENLRDRHDTTYMDNDLIMVDDLKDIPNYNGVQLDMIVLLACMEGKIQVDINGKTFHANKFDVVICPPNVFVNNYMVSPDFTAKILCLSYPALQRMLNLNKDVWDMIMFLTKHPVFHLDERLQEVLKNYYLLVRSRLEDEENLYKKEVIQAMLQAIFYEVCGLIRPYLVAEEQVEPGKLRQSDVLMKKFVKLLGESQGRERSVSYYADQLCVTPKYLSMSCKAASGKTALEWIHEYTVEVIIQQLRYSDLTIKQIANELNFANISFFGKFVRSHLGMSPTEYRRRVMLNSDLPEMPRR